jgi:acyl-[acyl-carrier-protein]-phospholipid O-acyltransferase/long-chain-fatty-acid--[acyl-carrier-protein] ligase
VPCDIKGEKLVVFYTRPEVTPADLWAKLNETPLPRLWIPKREHIIPIEVIPTLGTGKIDLQGLRTLARERISHEG